MVDFDFGAYVADRQRRGDDLVFPEYAYSADLSMLRTFRQMKAFDRSASALVEKMRAWWSAHYMGTTTRVGPRQFPKLHAMAEDCARTLGIPTPTLYVANSPVINAMTFGTQDEAAIIVHSAMIDHFDDDELRFVIGHECGHYQNKHVVYLTMLRLIEAGALGLIGSFMLPAVMPLRAWYRRAEITCDRAGLLCVRDLEAAERSFLKLACGSQKLYEQMDVETYLEQLDEAPDSVARYTESLQTHPYTPKRIKALRVFADSALYRAAAGLGEGGLPLAEVDRRTDALIQIVKRNDSTEAEADRGE